MLSEFSRKCSEIQKVELRKRCKLCTKDSRGQFCVDFAKAEMDLKTYFEWIEI